MPETSLLEAGRAGDEAAFRALTQPYVRELHVHCYRMLGSFQDAEDAFQETLVRAWRGLGRFEGRSSVRAWLYRIATNACLRAAERRSRQSTPFPQAPPSPSPPDPAETLPLTPYPDPLLRELGEVESPAARYDLRESVELAFLAAILPGSGASSFCGTSSAGLRERRPTCSTRPPRA